MGPTKNDGVRRLPNIQSKVSPNNSTFLHVKMVDSGISDPNGRELSGTGLITVACALQGESGGGEERRLFVDLPMT
jgi:hypothetical protein